MSKRERLLSEYVSWLDYADQHTIVMTGSRLFMMVALDGLPSETVDDRIINYRHLRLEAALRDSAQDGLIYHFLQCRGTADASYYPDGKFRTAFSEGFDQAYREALFGTRSMWLNQTYLAVQLSPREIPGSGLLKLFKKPATIREAPKDRMAKLRRIVGILMEELKEYNPRLLGVVKRNGRLFSEAAEATCFAMTGHWRQVPLTTSGAASIFSEAFIVGHESFEVRMPHKSAWGACLGMHDFPYMTSPGMFDRFLSANYRHTIFHGFKCMSPTDGEALITRRQNTMKTAGDRALGQVAELTEAANLVASRKMTMGDYAFGMTVFVDEHKSLSDAMQTAWGDLSSGGIKVERENITLEGMLFSNIPGNWHLRGRQAAVSSRNFAAFTSLHNYPTGDRKGTWGGPIAMFRTSGGSPYNFHFHSDGVGNMFCAGATGSGKTVLLGMLMSQSERAGAQVILFDKDRGLEAFVGAVSGSYLTLINTPGVGTGLAPLKRLTNSEEDLNFLAGMVRACVSTPEPYHFTAEEDRRLGIALRTVMSLPSELRDMSEVRGFLGTSRDGAGARLEKWCWGNELGWVVDCERDIVQLNDKMVAFDQSALLDDPIASGAVMATLFHYTGKLVDGRNLLFVLDEVWNALKVPTFAAQIKNGLKTWRKFNSPILMATQDVGDALDSPIADAIRGQTPTQIYFSDPKATWNRYGPEGMHLTETEFDIVQKLPKGTGHFLLKQGTRSVVLHAPLGGMDQIKVISGTRKGLRALAIARERTEASGMVLVDEYHRALAEVEAVS